MTWEEYAAARQLLAEEFHGVLAREVQRREREAFDATVAAIKQTQGT